MGLNRRNENDGRKEDDARELRLIPPRGDYQTLLSFQKAEVVHQTNYLIDRQLCRLEQDFLEQGGLRERMTRLQLARRNRSCP
jgi:four helix bundle suffix protein